MREGGSEEGRASSTLRPYQVMCHLAPPICSHQHLLPVVPYSTHTGSTRLAGSCSNLLLPAPPSPPTPANTGTNSAPNCYQNQHHAGQVLQHLLPPALHPSTPIPYQHHHQIRQVLQHLALPISSHKGCYVLLDVGSAHGEDDRLAGVAQKAEDLGGGSVGRVGGNAAEECSDYGKAHGEDDRLVRVTQNQNIWEKGVVSKEWEETKLGYT